MDGIEETLASDDLAALKNNGKFIFKFTKRGQPQVVSTMEDITIFKGINKRLLFQNSSQDKSIMYSWSC